MNDKQKDKKQQGIALFTRNISYSEAEPFISEGKDVSKAIEEVLKTEQEEWKRNNDVFVEVEGQSTFNADFFRQCFPEEVYILNEKAFSTASEACEHANCNKEDIEWNIQLNVEPDEKLKQLLENDKR